MSAGDTFRNSQSHTAEKRWENFHIIYHLLLTTNFKQNPKQFKKCTGILISGYTWPMGDMLDYRDS